MAKKILIVRFSALGDLLLTTSPLAQVRKSYPEATIDLLTSEIGEELFINSIDIDNTILVPKGSTLGSILKRYMKLSSYDIVVDLQGSFKSYLLKFFLNADFFHIKKQSKERRAFVKNRKYKDQLTKHVSEKYYDTFRRALPDLPALEAKDLRPQLSVQPIFFDNSSFDISKAIIIHPYASQKNKEWPYFLELCNELRSKEHPIVVVGANKESLQLPEDNQILDLTNRTSLREMASIISKGKLFVTTDSGPMHMAIALNKPTLALFGPTTKEFGFYPEYKNVQILEENLDCRPCHIHGGNECPLKHHNCMNNISLNKVILAIERPSHFETD